MAKEYSVYIHRHKINRKVYVCITNNIERRFRGEGGEYKNNGGEGTCGYIIPKESRQRMGNKISEIRTGIKFSEEHKRKLSMVRKMAIQKKRDAGEELYPFNKKPVLQFTMSGEFVDYYDSIKDAYENTGCINIGAICSGKRKSSNGYTWRWA